MLKDNEKGNKLISELTSVATGADSDARASTETLDFRSSPAGEQQWSLSGNEVDGDSRTILDEPLLRPNFSSIIF
jgi:hypothetical protein